jgi:hypothetical protein
MLKTKKIRWLYIGISILISVLISVQMSILFSVTVESDQRRFLEQLFDSSSTWTNMKWQQKFINNEVLQEVVNSRTKITSPLIAKKVVRLFAEFALTDEGKKMTTTNEVYDVIINHCAKQSVTFSQLKSAVDFFPRHEKYYTEHVRDLLISKKNLIVDAETADSVGKFLLSFSRVESRRSLLRTKEVQDVIVNYIAPHVTAISKFGGLICKVSRDQQSADFFINVESFSAILKCFHRSKTSNDARRIASSINNILAYNPSSNKLLNSLPVVEAFSFIIPLAKDAEAVQWISGSLLRILKNNEEAQNKFATPEFLKLLQGMEDHATTNNSNKQFQKVLELLM